LKAEARAAGFRSIPHGRHATLVVEIAHQRHGRPHRFEPASRARGVLGSTNRMAGPWTL
jgi:hypothetical protein